MTNKTPVEYEALQRDLHDRLKATSERLHPGMPPISAERKKAISDRIMNALPPLDTEE